MPASVDKKHDIPAEARNIVFMSSLAMNGEGRGIVIRTGATARSVGARTRNSQCPRRTCCTPVCFGWQTESVS